MIGGRAAAARRLRCGVAALAILGFAAGAHAQRLNEELDVGPWVIGNPANANGRFSKCIAYTTLDSGDGVVGLVSDGTIVGLLLVRPGATANLGARFNASYRFDGGAWTRTTGGVDAPDALSLNVPGPSASTLSAFAGVSQVEIQMPNNVTISSSLREVGPGIAALRRCVQAGLGR